MRGAPEATRWQSIHPNNNDGKASIKEEQQRQIIRSDEPNDGGTIKQAGQNIAKMSLKRTHTGTSQERETPARATGDGLRKCSNDAFRKDLDIHRCQQRW
jgi:hypothetical protein